METLNELYTNITKFWSTPGQCVLGHLTMSLKRYTEDWALVGLHREKIDWKDSKGNILGLGTFRSILSRSRVVSLLYLVSKFSLADVISKMCFHSRVWWPPPASGC